ncbi:MAG: serine O-acetyltransferase EpsC [Pseudomonadota bacterium]
MVSTKLKMSKEKDELINGVVDSLGTDEAAGEIDRMKPMPSLDILGETVELLRAVLFPGYFGFSDIRARTKRYHIGATLDRVMLLMTEQVRRGFCFFCAANDFEKCDECDVKAHDITTKFLAALPGIKDLLARDVTAAYEGDPAAESPGETIFCYPSTRALTNYRIAHALHEAGAKLVPRIITEIAHSETGIDIHPGAELGEKFFIDHGTGVVIGETSIVGKNVRIYQGVTLGAKSFPLDENGNPVKNIPRHPVVEDDVIIYGGATILGRITIGRGSVIGGNVWLTCDVPPGSKVMQGNVGDLRIECATS